LSPSSFKVSFCWLVWCQFRRACSSLVLNEYRVAFCRLTVTTRPLVLHLWRALQFTRLLACSI